jgi:hypothetical protein
LTLTNSNFRICFTGGAALSDLTQIGKMRDAYSLLIARVEHIKKLFENEAIPERLVWCPLCVVFNAIHLDTIGRATRLLGSGRTRP